MSGQRYFRVRDFEKLQHYKDRGPIWIKLYRHRLEDMDFLLLPDATKAHVVMLELLVAKLGNRLPFDPVFVAGQIGARERVDLQLLLDKGFIELEEPASDGQSDGASKSASGSAIKTASAAIKEERSRDTEKQITPQPPLPRGGLSLAATARHPVAIPPRHRGTSSAPSSKDAEDRILAAMGAKGWKNLATERDTGRAVRRRLRVLSVDTILTEIEGWHPPNDDQRDPVTGELWELPDWVLPNRVRERRRRVM